MKKFFTLVCALALVGISTVSAQNIKLGLKGGVSTKSYDFSSVTVGDAIISPAANSNVGFNVGLAMKLTIPKFIYVQPELMYGYSDYAYNVKADGYNVKTRVETSRFELPVLVGFNVKALRFFGGPKFILASSNSYSETNTDFRVDYVDTDVAFQIGCGFDIKNFFVDITYQTYFTDNSEKFTYGDSSTRVEVKDDSQWYFNVGFFF